MKILRKKNIEEQITYNLFFTRKDCPNSGSFCLCDKDGNVAEEHKERYNDLLNNENYLSPKIEKIINTIKHPAIGECYCGNEVVLSGFTNTCNHCNRDYNWAGQLLSSREAWGEETGESLQDILNIDCN